MLFSHPSQENIRRQRKIRVCAPHEGPDLVNIAVGGSGGTLIRNKFRKGSCFQVVYDWAGSMPIMPLYFSLHRAGGEIIRHTDRLQGHETLNSAQRDPQESFQFLGDEVTFFGNFHIDSHAEDTLREETVETLDCSKSCLMEYVLVRSQSLSRNLYHPLSLTLPTNKPIRVFVMFLSYKVLKKDAYSQLSYTQTYLIALPAGVYWRGLAIDVLTYLIALPAGVYWRGLAIDVLTYLIALPAGVYWRGLAIDILTYLIALPAGVYWRGLAMNTPTYLIALPAGVYWRDLAIDILTYLIALPAGVYWRGLAMDSPTYLIALPAGVYWRGLAMDSPTYLIALPADVYWRGLAMDTPTFCSTGWCLLLKTLI
ncbi:predicted protein [Nematostella vectensis]|uniref:Uncharacterized protein n=1 Tax=Nematostella vectensis TaxID=45351 RepID=A7RIM9_NEMVE|nr:predicted protein [Nematostella vectensis]|eukprot:XP_001640890.1 predicted protein [Nematostella vectensis]